jgi:hypothetical protein
MATSKSKDGGANIRYDDFIKKVKPDVANSEEVVLLHGYIGDSGKEDQIRVYSDAGLTEYIDIAKADILHAVPNSDDPLGGSQLWVKQSSNVNYNDPQGYAQGDMYNDYMSDSYAPDNFGTAGPVPILTQPVICGPTRFICPTPQSRLVICTIRPTFQINCQRTIVCPTRAIICQRPSWVDACPTRLGCNPGATIINPGGGQFSDDYGTGDVYNDYMNDSYDGGAAPGGFAPVTTSPQCFQLQTQQINCQISLRVICITQRSPCISRQWLCLTRNNIRSLCRPCWVTPPFRRTPTIQTPGNPGAGRGFNDAYGSYDDYGGGEAHGDYSGAENFGEYGSGDLYGDYMANDYAPDAGTGAAAAPITTVPVCIRPTIQFPNCWPTNPVNCRTQPNFPPCRTRFPFCRTRQPITPCRIRTIAIHICFPTRICAINPGGPNPGVPMNDPYGSYGDSTGEENYGDYGSGDLYGDYMANDYAPDAGAETGTAAAAPITALPNCLRPTNPLVGCPRTYPLNCRSFFSPCFTNPAYPPCRRTQFQICRTNPAFPPCNVTRNLITPCRRTINPICLITRNCPINPGGGNFDSGYNDPYGGYGY